VAVNSEWIIIYLSDILVSVPPRSVLFLLVLVVSAALLSLSHSALHVNTAHID